MGKGRFYTKPKAKRHQERIAAYSLQLFTQLRQHPEWDKKSDVCVYAHFYRANKRPCDVDNLCKTLLDGMKKILFEDDAQVIRSVVHRGYDINVPRTFVMMCYGAGDGFLPAFMKEVEGIDGKERRAMEASGMGQKTRDLKKSG